MAHFAEIFDGVVQRVIVVHNNEEANGAQFCHDLLGGVWVQCSVTTIAFANNLQVIGLHIRQQRRCVHRTKTIRVVDT
jgi:hypothetical protein